MEPTADHQQLEWLSRAINALIESPQVHERITEAFRRDDSKTFARVLTEHWRKYGIEPPADKCDPYVASYAFAVRPPNLVQRCYFTLAPASSSTPTTFKPPSGTSQAILQWLIANGLVQCTWVWEKQEAELQVIKKFVEGICPPGTF